MKKFLILILGLGLIIVAGCEKFERPSGTYIAKVNNSVISEDDFLKEISLIPEWARKNFSGKEGKERFLKELINKELIYQDAINRGLQNDRELAEKIEEFRKMSLLTIVLKKEIEEKAEVTESETKEFYDGNTDNFKTGEEVRARHILVDTEEKANDILSSIIKGESFAELAKTFSMDKGSAQNGGDLGFFSRGKMIPEFEETAFSLKKGEVSKPVKTTYGYHLIETTDKREGSQIQFEEAKENIKNQLVKEKQKTLFESYIETLKNKTDIKTDEERLSNMKLPWEAAEQISTNE
jgi:peptidyl-prolyl cis-trans isomerase C